MKPQKFIRPLTEDERTTLENGCRASDAFTVGKRALVLMWDNASWHISHEVRQWIGTHNRTVKLGGGCRLLMFRLPSKSPWLNPIEPKWVHGKRAVSEPVRILSGAELMQPICTYYNCALEDLLVQEGC